MPTKRNASRLTVQFDDAEARRLRLIELEHFAKLDFPCSVLLVDPAAVGAATEMSTIPKAKLTHWLKLFDEGYFYSLSKAAGAVRGDKNSAYDRLPTVDAYLRRHDANDGRLLAFAERLLALSDEERCNCTVGIYGAPDDSEDSGFAPRRRAFVGGAGSTVADAGECGTQTHAFVIRSALIALGPKAAVKNAPNDDPAERAFRLCWSLATEAWIPWLWMGADDSQAALAQLYVNECARLVRTEYDWWLSKSPKELGEDNPVLRWLSTPTEPNRLAVLDFALRHLTAVRTRNPSRKRGRKSVSDPKEDRRIADAWSSGSYSTFADLDRELELSSGTARRAVDRHRKRK